MSSVTNQQGSVFDTTRIREFVDEHFWNTIWVSSTVFFIVVAFILDAAGWPTAGGVTMAFVFLWVLNILAVKIFFRALMKAVAYAEYHV